MVIYIFLNAKTMYMLCMFCLVRVHVYHNVCPVHGHGLQVAQYLPNKLSSFDCI